MILWVIVSGRSFSSIIKSDDTVLRPSLVSPLTVAVAGIRMDRKEDKMSEHRKTSK